ncbi:MAG: adenylate/guanylate cyclase domain-containing protein [Reyranella sp.]
MPVEAPKSSAVETALFDAERKGFRLAVLGRTCALVALAVFYAAAFPWPNNMAMAAVFLAAAAVGLVPLALVGGRFERSGRFAFFAFDIAAISAMLAFAPLSSGGEIPQNFIFFSSRHHYYYVVVALSVLTLSPALVLWTGFCAVAGFAGATSWIVSGMERVSSFGDLPRGPSREQFLAVVFDPDFLAIAVRVNEGLVIALSTGIAALAVHRARNVVRAHAAAEEKRSRVQQLLGRYVPAQVAQQLVDSGQLAPQLREATILFADIEGFTRLSERLTAAQVIGLLNGFFGAAAIRVEAEGGIVVNHVGDALIAAFNAPLPVSDHAARAVGAARALQALVSGRNFEGHRLRLRVGIATGPVAAGTVGGATSQTYTVYGDTVNVAQRLERLNKELETDCLICGTTFADAQSACAGAVPMGATQVRGRESTVEVFALK